MDPTAEFAQLQRHMVEDTQWRYEVIRPLVLLADRTATQRAQETHTHPDTVRTLTRRFRRQGMVGLLPAHMEVIPYGKNIHTAMVRMVKEFVSCKISMAGLD